MNGTCQLPGRLSSEHYYCCLIHEHGRFSSCPVQSELWKKKMNKNTPCSSWNDRTRQSISPRTEQKIAHFMYWTISQPGRNIHTLISKHIMYIKYNYILCIKCELRLKLNDIHTPYTPPLSGLRFQLKIRWTRKKFFCLGVDATVFFLMAVRILHQQQQKQRVSIFEIVFYIILCTQCLYKPRWGNFRR